MTTLILDPDTFAGAEARVEGDAYRHLFRARRLAVGDRLRVVDGAGGPAGPRCRPSIAIGIRSACSASPRPPNEPAYRLELLVATPKPERASWLVEKATELGVTGGALRLSERSPRSFGGLVARAAAGWPRRRPSNAGRALVPEVTGVHALGGGARAPRGLAGAVVPAPRSRKRREGATLRPVDPAGAGAVLDRPRGRLERGRGRGALPLGCRPVHLGERVLRVETAALVAAANDPHRRPMTFRV
jgi:16S rRNA (uracil1498-N3)-methyltransferase